MTPTSTGNRQFKIQVLHKTKQNYSSRNTIGFSAPHIAPNLEAPTLFCKERLHLLPTSTCRFNFYLALDLLIAKHRPRLMITLIAEWLPFSILTITSI